jgi:hypothetical protein
VAVHLTLITSRVMSYWDSENWALYRYGAKGAGLVRSPWWIGSLALGVELARIMLLLNLSRSSY